jgi:biotin operon repressor
MQSFDMCVLTKSKNKYICTIVLRAKLGIERKMLQQKGDQENKFKLPQ